MTFLLRRYASSGNGGSGSAACWPAAGRADATPTAGLRGGRRPEVALVLRAAWRDGGGWRKVSGGAHLGDEPHNLVQVAGDGGLACRRRGGPGRGAGRRAQRT